MHIVVIFDSVFVCKSGSYKKMSSEKPVKLKHIHKVKGDGNCLLRAVGLQTNKTHIELRNDLYNNEITLYTIL
jgi:hypothetical protein